VPYFLEIDAGSWEIRRSNPDSFPDVTSACAAATRSLRALMVERLREHKAIPSNWIRRNRRLPTAQHSGKAPEAGCLTVRSLFVRVSVIERTNLEVTPGLGVAMVLAMHWGS
jgi:hypothetical protein